MKKAAVILTTLLISISAMAQDKPQQVSDKIIQEVQAEYAPIYCEPHGLEKAAKAVEACYMKTNREDPAIEKCIWADIMVGTSYNTLKKTSDERGLPDAFTPFLL